MKKTLTLIAITVLGLMLCSAPKAEAGVHVGVQVGVPVVVEPACPWGYYPSEPYGCAPYGYWGPDYFVDGVFIGAGPWYHGDDDRWWRHHGWRYRERWHRDHNRGWNPDHRWHDRDDDRRWGHDRDRGYDGHDWHRH